MAIFELQGADGQVYEVDAPDQSRAVSAFKKMQGTAFKEGSILDYIPAAISDIPSEIGRAATENIDAIHKGLVPSGQGQRGQLERLGDTGKGLLAIPGLALSPLTGAARSLFGHPLAEVENYGRKISGMPADEEGAYNRGKGSADLAMAALGSRGTGARASVAPAGPGREVVSAAERLNASGNPVDVPQAIASDSMIPQRAGQALRNIPIVGDAIPKATARLGGQLEEAAGSIASEFGHGSGPNVSHNIGQTLRSSAEAESQTARTTAAQSDSAVLADWERSITGANEAIAGQETATLHRARQALGDMSPQDMGETLVARLRAGEQEARANKDRLYGIAASSDGAVRADVVRGMRADVETSLFSAGRVVDPVLTPASSRMMAELDNAPMQLSGDMNRSGSASPVRVDAPAPKPSAQSSAARSAEEPPPPQGKSLLEFLAERGGLGPDAELGAIGADGHVVNVTGAGRRRLVKQGGLPLDYAREAAEEAGYLRGSHGGTSSPRDLLDAIDAEIRGQKRFAEGFEGSVSKREAAAQSERAQHEYDAFKHGLERDLAEAGHGKLKPDVRQRALELMENERLDANSAVQRAFRDLEQEDGAVRRNFPGGVLPADPAVSMQALEQTRKRLNAMSQAATNDADRSAARMIIREFDNRLGNAFDNALFSGSEEALQSFRAARAANTEWRARFGFNARDDADRVINRIVTGEVTPQEVANYVIGATQVGAKGVSSRLLTRIAEATGGDPDAMGAIRAGVWNRLSQSTEGAAPKQPLKVTSDIYEFLNGSGRDVAQRLFSDPQQAIMRAYADTLRQGAAARETVADIAANTRPSPMEVGAGPLQKLADAVLGGGAGRSDEAIYSAINSYAKSGAKGDINLLSKIVQAIPSNERGNLASALIRDMGVSSRTGQFSPDVFVSAWNTYTPQAKAVLFGMSGAQRRALDDIAIISQRMKEVGSKFGNPSGTAQNVNFLALAGSVVTAPLTTLTTALGGAVTAKILASPVGASSVSKWSRSYELMSQAPSLARIESFKRATALLAVNIHQDTGMPVKELIRQIQGPVPTNAEDKRN